VPASAIIVVLAPSSTCCPPARRLSSARLEADARSLASEPDGLVLVAGPAGSDKSAILSAFVDEINRNRADYMITIEPCVYLVHENVQALVSQREVGADAARAVAATRAALNENPDVLVVDDLASGEVAELRSVSGGP
jgi:twitching motility protein PilT